jgi:hypothetical protein
MKNPAPIETIDKEKHSKLKVKLTGNLEQAKEYNLVSISIGELSATASNFPVVLIEHPENKNLRPVAMMGLRPGENVYYGETRWDCTYIPLVLQRAPFVIGYDDREEDVNSLTACIDTSSPLVNETEGEPLFKEDGEASDYLVNRNQLLQAIFEGERFTEGFVNKVKELDLISPVEILIQPESGEPRKVSGMYTLNERKLKELTQEQQLELLKEDYLPACYIIMASLFQVHRLMGLRDQKGVEKIQSYRIVLDPASQPQQPSSNQ